MQGPNAVSHIRANNKECGERVQHTGVAGVKVPGGDGRFGRLI